MGVHLALDDFGTGYSSLAYLRDLPFDSVKIDKSLVHGSALIEAILGLCKALQLEPIAERIEQMDQAVALQNLGCRLAQGNYCARPNEAHIVQAVLRADGPASEKLAA